LQVKSHAPLLHSARELAGGWHGAQLMPQLSIESLRLHSSPQRWKPVSQVKSQRSLVQTGTALSMPPQFEHEGPQAEALLSASQPWPQEWKPERQVQVLRCVSHRPGCGQSAFVAQPGRHRLLVLQK